jgi:hypothetical protein
MPDTTRSLSGETWAREFALNRPRYSPHIHAPIGSAPSSATEQDAHLEAVRYAPYPVPGAETAAPTAAAPAHH